MKKRILILLCLCLAVVTLFGCTLNGVEEETTVPPANETTVSGTTIPYIDELASDTHSIRVILDQKKRTYKMFEIEIATDETFENIVSSNLYNFEITTLYNLTPDTLYYVRTRGYDGTNYSAYSEICSIQTSSVLVEELSFDTETLDLFVGDEYSIGVVMTPGDVTDNTLTWTSSDESVATVSDGIVTAVGTGNAAILATSVNGKRTACAVHVGKKTVTNATEALTIDKSTLNGNAVFGRYYIFRGPVEKNYDFDGDYHLNSFAVENVLIDDTYYFGGLYKEVNVDGIPFTYTWATDSGFDFDGNDCALVSDAQSTQTLRFIGAGAYETIYLLSLADDAIWNDTFKSNPHWEMSDGDIIADVTVTYSDGTSETKSVNFGNMMKYNVDIPSYDQYTLSSNVARLVGASIGDAGTAPYMYAVPVTTNPEKQIASLTLNLENTDARRKVNLAVFAVSGVISTSAPAPIEEDEVTISNLTEYGFNIAWTAKENADGYYVSIFEDEDCTTPVFVTVLSKKIYLSQADISTTSTGFSNNMYPAGKTYYVTVSAYNEHGSSQATMIPVTTLATYPAEIRLKNGDTNMTKKEAELAIGESLTLTVQFPTVYYYTYSEITWTSSDDKVLRVEDGKIVGTAIGTAVVRAALTQKPEIYAECTITVTGYGEGWVGYDNGIYATNDTFSTVISKFATDISASAIRITDEQLTEGRILDKIQYYVSLKDTISYEIYLVDEGQSLFTAKPVAEGEIQGTKIGWNTAELTTAVEVPEGKELWIVVQTYEASRSDNESENGSWAYINSGWSHYDDATLTGTLMLRAHFKEE